MHAVRLLVCLLSRLVLGLRYRLTITGLDEAKRQKGPLLLLPNHPGYCDPPNLIAHLFPHFTPRPLLLGSIFRNPVLAPFRILLRAIQVPDLAEASAEARQQAEAAVGGAIDCLKAGENVILWPSGRVMRDGVERVGANRGVSDILTAVPNATVVLIRTRGLWGSSFTVAYEGKKPSITRRLIEGALILASNLVVLTPRRRVTVAMEAFPPDRRPSPTRECINPWMDEWFNRGESPEVPTFVPYHPFFGARSHDYPPPPAGASLDLARVKPATKDAVAEIVAAKRKRPVEAADRNPESTLMDLGFDSLDAMEVALEVENRFGFRGDMPATVGQLWALAEGQAETKPPPAPPAKWFDPPRGSLKAEVLGETVPAAVVNRVLAGPKELFCADDTSGVLTYERLLLGASVLAARFRDLPERHVGLMLPASAGGIIALVALHLAKKVPVILNWTTGPGNMAHAVKLLGVETVVTSKRFVDRAQVEVPGAEFLFLENVRGGVGKVELLRRLLFTKLFPRRVAANLLSGVETDPDQPAVVLFTSGSEKAPKAVPLTHRNVIADLRAALPLLELDRTESAMVFLPLFHSFGHTVTGLLPVFCGVKAVYHPDPTDAGALVTKIAAYKTTATATTPTFLNFLFDKAKGDELGSLRVLVVGAEKCPDSVFDRAAKLAPKAAVMEGYGVTECSPVVSVNPRRGVRRGTIGRPLVGVDVRAVDVDSGAWLNVGEMGMLLVAGPNVFPGYLGHEGDSPFREVDGKRWYVTGDLGSVCGDGYITFSGRLKRFLKAGGEMISLPALEEPFAAKFPPTEAGPRAAVEGIETPDGRRVVLFTTEEVSLKEANALLQAEGFRGVMRLDEVRKVESIPLLGTGKTDYKVLRKMIDAG